MIQAPPSPARRQELAAFLRARRNAMSPTAFGFEIDENRHVSGLRREEIGALAGISATWYTWLEQGREINVSPDVVEKVANAMRLGKAEREFVRLMVSDAPSLRHAMQPNVPEVLRTLVETHDPAPAYIATPRFDLVVWNDFVAQIFDYSREDKALSRNIVWRLFFDNSRRSLYAQWEDVARRTVAAFRFTRARYLGDPHFEKLLATLMKSDDFERLWNLNEVEQPGLPPFMIRHNTLGVCEFTTVQASLDVAAGCYLALFASKRLS